MKQKTFPSRRGYKWRIFLNSFLVLAVVLICWTVSGFALPSRLAFRVMERQRLLTASEILLDEGLSSRCRVLMGVTEQRIHAAAPKQDRFYTWERTGQPTLILLPDDYREPPTFAMVDAPADAASARLVMTFVYEGTIRHQPVEWSGEYTMDGVLTDDVFLFQPTRQYDPMSTDPAAQAEDYWFEISRHSLAHVQLPYHAVTFFDRDGHILSTVTGGGT